MKLGKIKLLDKPNKNPADINSHRPIALLSTLGKVYEKNITLCAPGNKKTQYFSRTSIWLQEGKVDRNSSE